MPGIVMFHRRWRIGSDDFVFPAFADIILRIFWFCVILVEFVKYREQWDCGGGSQWLHTYVKYSLASLSSVMFLDILIAWMSSRGTIVQDRPRRHLPKILYLRLLVMTGEAVWNGFGTRWAFAPHDPRCEPGEGLLGLQVACACSWPVWCLAPALVAVSFDPSGSVRSGRRVADVERGEPRPLYVDLSTSSTAEKAKRAWEWQLRLLCCLRPSRDDRSESAYSDVAGLLARHFEEDLVPSDVALGLILLRQKQAAEGASPQENAFAQSPDSLTSTGAVQGSVLSSPGASPSGRPWMSAEAAAHFLPFALASYGWPLFLCDRGCCGLAHLCGNLRCRCRRPAPAHLSDDDCLECRSAALRSAAGLRDEDLVFASFRNRVFEPPFFVALDHPSRSVVVSVRGTLSPSDALTDLTADAEPLDCCEGAACHRGVLRAALFVSGRLEESRALSQALALHQGYSLALTGHSLGAGVAALLALLLRPTHPGLRCFAFAPPGGLLSPEAARRSEDCVMSVVLGDDAVPRLSVASVEDLKRKILASIEGCQRPKYKVFLSQCFGRKRGDPEGDPSRPLLDTYAARRSQSPKPPTAAPLHLPGRILHVTRARSGFRARWSTPDHFDHIVVSPRMLSDHLPHALDDALRRLARADAGFEP